MYRKHLWAGVVLLAMGVTGAQTAPVKRVARNSARATQVMKARPAAKRPVAKRPVPARLSARPVAPAVSRMAAPVKRRPVRRALWAQAAISDAPTMAAISREAEPLMLRALGAYYVTDEMAFRDMRSRGWSFADLATAGNLAARSRRSLYEVARDYEQRRDWTMVAQNLNVPAEEVFVAVNSPRYVMVRPTPEEEARMIASMTPAGTPPTTAQAPAATAPDATAPPATTVAPGATATPPGAPAARTPGTPGTPPPTTVPAAPEAPVAPGTPPGTPGNVAPPVTPDATAAPPATPDATGALAPAPMPTRTIMTPVERVAASRLEMVPREPATLLRSAVATYYAMPTSTVRQLESQGWTLGDILIAGNLAHRSEASLEEVVVLHDGGNDWNAIASRVGVAPEHVYQPTMIRRVTTVPVTTVPVNGHGR